MIGTSAPVRAPQLLDLFQDSCRTLGAGFYLNATNPKYAKHYNMKTHVTLELPQTLEAAGIPIV